MAIFFNRYAIHIASCCMLIVLVSGQQFPFQDPKLAWSVRVDDLVSRLTFEEIVNQSRIIYGQVPPSVERLGIHPYQWNTECLRGVVGRNSTAFPQSIGLAATFRYFLI